MRRLLQLISLAVLFSLPIVVNGNDISFFHATISSACPQCGDKLTDSTGAYILEYGEESLLARAWLTDNATESIDVQYFIWSTDNIGILASESLLRAAERQVKVRVIVDDFLIDADDDVLFALNAHPNITIKIYNHALCWNFYF